MFYHFPDGRCLYLAWQSGERPKQLLGKQNAWFLDAATLREAKYRGATAIGVAHRIGKTVHYYVVNADDWWNPPSESHSDSGALCRKLSRNEFHVNTSVSNEALLKAMKLR